MKTISAEPIADANALIVQSLAKLDVIALGAAVGLLGGLVVFLATNILIYKGGEEIGPNLALLGHYFIGYDVTTAGSFVGFFYGFTAGFLVGSIIAFLRNFIVAVYLNLLRFKSNFSATNDFIDNP